MAKLNYHHLHYFWVIANENNLTRAAERLHISQSALSIQLKTLEESFGQTLFERQGKRLILTEAGHIALDYATAIFQTGDELLNLMHNRPVGNRQLLRVGVVSTLSRNFQLGLIKPLLNRNDIELVLHSGSLKDLLAKMHLHTLDLVISNRALPRDAETNWNCMLLDEQSASLVGKPEAATPNFRFPEDLQNTPLLLPSMESEIRAAFNFVLEQADIRPLIVAEVDDMAMLRLLVRDSNNLALVPPVVVQDELQAGLLVEHYRFPEIRERFYAITPTRRFPNAILREMLAGVGA